MVHAVSSTSQDDLGPVLDRMDGSLADALAARAASSAVRQRRLGAREPTRVLYYGAHSLLRSLRQHLAPSPSPRAAH